MPTTPTYALPYPAQTDPADVPVDMQELAERVETVLGGLPVPAFVKIADSLLGGTAASIDFLSIPATYAHLAVLVYLRSTAAAATSALGARFNNDSGANYDQQIGFHQGNSASGSELFATSAAGFGNAIPANSAPAGSYGSYLIVVPSYRETTGHKELFGIGGSLFGTTGATNQLSFGHSRWRSTAAVNRLTIFPASGSLAAGSRGTLYGLG